MNKYISQENWSCAITECERLLSFERNVPLIDLHYTYGALLYIDHQYDKALDEFDYLIKICDSCDWVWVDLDIGVQKFYESKLFKLDVYIKISEIFEELKNTPKSYEMLLHALEIAQDVFDKLRIAEIQYKLALILYTNPTEAIERLENAHEIFEYYGKCPESVDCLNIMSQAYHRINDLQNAYHYAQEACEKAALYSDDLDILKHRMLDLAKLIGVN